MATKFNASLLSTFYDPAVKQMLKIYDMAKAQGVSKELLGSIEDCLIGSQERDAFAEECSTQHSEVAARIDEVSMTTDWDKLHEDKTTTVELKPRFLSGLLEGQLLKSIISIQKAKRALDVGMFTGYSALCMAEALPADGQVVTLEVDQYLKNLVEDLTKDSPHKHKIKIVIGPALESMAKFQSDGDKFDVVFIDAVKAEYKDYVDMVLDGGLLSEGGTIVVDNALFHGTHRDPQSDIAKFGAYIKSRTDIHKVLLPIRDGVYLIRRLEDVQGKA